MGKWKFVGGSIAIDFVNTIGGRTEKSIDNYFIRDDQFNHCNDIVDWAEAIGLIGSTTARKIKAWISEHPEYAKKKFEHAKAFRETLYRMLRRSMKNMKMIATDMELLNKACAAARKNQRIVYRSGNFSWEFDVQEYNPDMIMHHVAIAAADLLTSEKLLQLKQCKGEDCGWLFIDTSKNRKRVWCDMKDCGNLAKVRRFRSKQKLN